jgi:hypothetical protein
MAAGASTKVDAAMSKTPTTRHGWNQTEYRRRDVFTVIAQPHEQRALDLRLAGEQLVERAIPLLQLPRSDPHPRRQAGLAFGVVAPCRDETAAAAVADKIVLQPLRQRMFASWRRQSIGDQHQRTIAQPHRVAAIRPRQLIEHRFKAELAPHRTRRQHRPPVPRAERADIIARDTAIVGRFAVQQAAKLVEIQMGC